MLFRDIEMKWWRWIIIKNLNLCLKSLIGAFILLKQKCKALPIYSFYNRKLFESSLINFFIQRDRIHPNYITRVSPLYFVQKILRWIFYSKSIYSFMHLKAFSKFSYHPRHTKYSQKEIPTVTLRMILHSNKYKYTINPSNIHIQYLMTYEAHNSLSIATQNLLYQKVKSIIATNFIKSYLVCWRIFLILSMPDIR